MKNMDWAAAYLKDTDQDAQSWQSLLRAQEFCRQERDATVTVDVQGRIIDHSRVGARMLGCQAENLIGQRLSQFLDQLPFNDNTPDDNLAYAVFHSAGDRWHRHAVATPDGRRMEVDVALSNVMMHGNPAIQFTLKPTDSGQQTDRH